MVDYNNERISKWNWDIGSQYFSITLLGPSGVLCIVDCCGRVQKLVASMPQMVTELESATWCMSCDMNVGGLTTGIDCLANAFHEKIVWHKLQPSSRNTCFC